MSWMTSDIKKIFEQMEKKFGQMTTSGLLYLYLKIQGPKKFRSSCLSPDPVTPTRVDTWRPSRQMNLTTKSPPPLKQGWVTPTDRYRPSTKTNSTELPPHPTHEYL